MGELDASIDATLEEALKHLKLAITLLSGLPSVKDRLRDHVPEASGVRAPVAQLGPVTRASKGTMATSRLVDAVARLEHSSPIQMHVTLVASLFGTARDDKAFQKSLKEAETEGLILRTGDQIALLERGRAYLNEPIVAITSGMLGQAISQTLSGLDRRLFELLFNANGASVAKRELAHACREDEEQIYESLSTLMKYGLARRESGDRYSCSEMVYLG